MSSARGEVAAARGIAAALCYQGRGYDVGEVISMNADATYKVNVLARTDAGDDGTADYDAVENMDPRNRYAQGDFVLLHRIQGSAGKVGITGRAPWSTALEPETIWI